MVRMERQGARNRARISPWQGCEVWDEVRCYEESPVLLSRGAAAVAAAAVAAAGAEVRYEAMHGPLKRVLSR